MRIAHRLAALETRIDAACAAAGRPRSEVRLLAASKTHGAPAVEEALAAGQTLFGESRAQELRDKARTVQVLGQVQQPEWHFIGHLQRNKVKYVVGAATMVHTVDSLKLAQALGKRVLAERSRGMVLPDVQVLVQVNLGSEWKKSGVAPDEALAACRQIADIEGISLRGLMAIPPYRPDPEKMAPYFETLAGLAATGRARGLDLTELSMGMSHDFEVAIQHGATIVRVGTAIFGSRRG